MLIRFTVSNFLSFKDETEFNMLTGDVKRHPHHVYKREHIDVLRAAAIYGANGAGKSNLIYAIAFLKSTLIGEDILKTRQYFRLSNEYKNKFSGLEIELEIKGITYAYGIEFDDEKIIKEWLYKINFKYDEKDEMIFERETDNNLKHTLKLADKYLKTEKEQYFVEFYKDEIIKPNFSFCSLVEQKEKYEEIDSVYNWFKYNLFLLKPDAKIASLIHDIEVEEYSNWFNSIINSLDTGIKRVYAENFIPDKSFDKNNETIKKRLKGDKDLRTFFMDGGNYFSARAENGEVAYKILVCEHKNDKNQSVAFVASDESDGTQKLLDIIPILWNIKENDSVFIIDEIDRSIHPSLLKTFIKLLMEMPNSKGQIIFTTHESNLLDLDIFRQDEIWFAEKNKEGATQFYSLADFKPRYDLDIRKGYLNGRFGAIPFLGDLEKLNLNHHAETE